MFRGLVTAGGGLVPCRVCLRDVPNSLEIRSTCNLALCGICMDFSAPGCPGSRGVVAHCCMRAGGEEQAPTVPGSGRATRHICPHIVLALPKRRRTSLLNWQQHNVVKGHVLAAQGPWPIRLLIRHGEGEEGWDS